VLPDPKIVLTHDKTESGCAMGLTTTERHNHLHSEMKKLDQSPLAMVDASPGPWWGFNGVDTLALTQGQVWLSASRLARPPRLVGFDLAEVEVVESRKRRPIALPRARPVTVFRLRLGSRVRRFAAEDSEAATRFLSSLRERLAASA
jgi:hypothetical protein